LFFWIGINGFTVFQTTVRELPTSVELAGVNMRLDEGAIRELHWHKEVNDILSFVRPSVPSAIDVQERTDLTSWLCLGGVGLYVGRKSTCHCLRH